MNFRQLAAGVISLVLGMVVYITARPEWVLWLPDFNLSHYFPPFLNDLSGPLPSFFHVLGMSLITSGILMANRSGIAAACLFWAFINILFELGQHPTVAALIKTTPGTSDSWILTHTLQYFLAGTFDPMDLLAILLGAVLAYTVAVVLMAKKITTQELQLLKSGKATEA